MTTYTPYEPQHSKDYEPRSQETKLTRQSTQVEWKGRMVDPSKLMAQDKLDWELAEWYKKFKAGKVKD